MRLKERLLRWLGLEEPSNEPQITHHLSRLSPRHEFTVLKALPENVFKVRIRGRVELLDMCDWKLFERSLSLFCMQERVLWSDLERGITQIRCVGFQESVPKGIRYSWTFNKL